MGKKKFLVFYGGKDIDEVEADTEDEAIDIVSSSNNFHAEEVEEKE